MPLAHEPRDGVAVADALEVAVARGAKSDYDEGDTVGAVLNLSTIGPQGIVTGPLTGTYEGVKAAGELEAMSVQCAGIEAAYAMGEIGVDDKRLQSCSVPFLMSPEMQKQIMDDYINGN